MKQHLIYAMKDGEIMSIEDVERGLKCGCTCAACGERLIAKKGMERKHHFSHPSGSTCEYGYETSLHLMAKEILSKAGKMIIPDISVQFPNKQRNPILVSKKREIIIDKVELEHRVSDVIPDVIVYSGDETFFVEVYVTHAVDFDKICKLKEIGIPTLEINLSQMDESVESKDLEKVLLHNSHNKYWVYHPLIEAYYDRFRDAADVRQATRHENTGLARLSSLGEDRIYNCPVSNKRFHNMQYANIWTDCFYCPYCFSYTNKDVHCLRRKGIRDVKSLERSGIVHGKRFPAVDEQELVAQDMSEPPQIQKVVQQEPEPYEPRKLSQEEILQTKEEALREWAKKTASSHVSGTFSKDYASEQEYSVQQQSLFHRWDTGSKDLSYDSFLSHCAVDILMKVQAVRVPAVYVDLQEIDMAPVCIKGSAGIAVDYTENLHFSNSRMPGFLIHFGDASIYVNLFTESRMNDEDLQILKTQKIPVLGLNLKSLQCSLSMETLKVILSNDDKSKEWIYHPLADEWLQRAQETADMFIIDENGHVMECPNATRSWQGMLFGMSYNDFIENHDKQYADFKTDCHRCSHYAGCHDGCVRCLARLQNNIGTK